MKSEEKEVKFFEDTKVKGATLENLDIPFLKKYIEKIGYSKDEDNYLRENNYLLEKDGEESLSIAAILLFGKKPQDSIPMSKIRFIKYESTEENVEKDTSIECDYTFEGNIYEILQKCIKYIEVYTKGRTFIEEDLFIKKKDYPMSVVRELIVNAVAHRDYSIKEDIQVKMFDDKLIVESPGTLLEPVTKENIRKTRFSRNPKIVEYLKVFEYMDENGVDGIYKELESNGFREIEYNIDASTIKVVVYNKYNRIINETDINSKLYKSTLENLLESQSFSENVRKDIMKIYENVETNQVVVNRELHDILKKSESTVIKLKKIMKELDILVEVRGKGRGKYRFKNESEIKNK